MFGAGLAIGLGIGLLLVLLVVLALDAGRRAEDEMEQVLSEMERCTCHD